MMCFVKLTLLNGTGIRINMVDIESYGIVTKDNYKYCKEEWIGKIFLIPYGLPDDNNIYVVEETPEEIDDKIYNTIYSTCNKLYNNILC